MIKKLLLPLLLSCSLFSNELEYKGNVGFESKYLLHDIANKRDSALTLVLEARVKKSFGDSEVVAKLKALFDKDDKNRRYFDFTDLYYLYNFENSDILIGRNSRFWGALEFYNITDVFNTKDFLDDVFDYKSKLGSWNVAYTKYFDNSDLSLIVKLHEQRQKMQDQKSVDYFFPLDYDDELITSKGKNRPTIFLKYSGSGDEVQIDYSLIYQNGYDQNRYMIVKNGKLRQNAYIVNKFLGFFTLVIDDTIYKSELSFAKSDDKTISKYSHAGFGLEHTLYSFWDTKDLGLLMEYYRYSGDGSKESFFANDLSIGFRLSMNDLDSSEVLGGVDIDIDNQEKITFIKYDTRVYNSYKLSLSYQYLDPKQNSLFPRLNSLKLEFGYYF